MENEQTSTEAQVEVPASEENVIEEEQVVDSLFDTFDEQELAEGDDSTPLEPKEEPKEKVDAPVSWDKDGKELFAKLPIDIQKQVAHREQEREKAINTSLQEKATYQKREQAVLEYANTELRKALKDAQIAIHGEFADIDVRALKQSNPLQYLELEALYEKRMDAVNQVAAQVQQIEQIQEKEHKKYWTQHLHQEFANQQQVLGELFPEYAQDKSKGKEIRADLVSYMKQIGAPDDHVNGINYGYQLQVLLKSMLYDKMVKNSKNVKSSAPKQLNKTQGAKTQSSSKLDDLFKL